MTGRAPVLHVLAGPNGAGKSTLYRTVLAPVMALPFVNADLIAAAARAAGDDLDAYAAAGVAAAWRRQLIEARRSFVAETVFSHPSKVELVADAQAAGFLVTMHVVLAPLELCVARVAIRERHGGHGVPEAKVRSRWQRLWPLVADAAGRADETWCYDSSRGRFDRVAHLVNGTLIGEPDWPAWTPPGLRGFEAPDPA